MAGEGGLVAVAAIESDIDDRFVSVDEHVGGGFDSGFTYKLGGCDFEHLAHPAIELGLGELGDVGQFRRLEVFGKIVVDFIDHLGESGEAQVFLAGGEQIAGDGGQTDDVTAFSHEWDFSSQVPSERPVAVEHELEPVIDFFACIENVFVLSQIAGGQMGRENLCGGFPKDFVYGPESQAFGKGGIG